MKHLLAKVYDTFDAGRKYFEAELADREDLKEIESLEKQLKKRGDDE